MNGFGLSEVHFVEHRETVLKEHVAPVYARIIADELCVAHLVVILVDIAQGYLVVACLCNACFDGHNCLHLLFGSRRVVTYHLKHFLHEGFVGLTNLDSLCIVVEIVVTGAETYATLLDRDDVHAGIAHVCSHADAEHHGVVAPTVEL